MVRITDRPGFAEAVLNSEDDYEPYGFTESRLMPVAASQHAVRYTNNSARRQRALGAAALRELQRLGY